MPTLIEFRFQLLISIPMLFFEINSALCWSPNHLFQLSSNIIKYYFRRYRIIHDATASINNCRSRLAKILATEFTFSDSESEIFKRVTRSLLSSVQLTLWQIPYPTRIGWGYKQVRFANLNGNLPPNGPEHQ